MKIKYYEKKRYIKLNGITYDLEKIKIFDRALFLDYCKIYGTMKWAFFPFFGNYSREWTQAINYFIWKDKGKPKNE